MLVVEVKVQEASERYIYNNLEEKSTGFVSRKLKVVRDNDETALLFFNISVVDFPFRYVALFLCMLSIFAFSIGWVVLPSILLFVAALFALFEASKSKGLQLMALKAGLKKEGYTDSVKKLNEDEIIERLLEWRK